MKPKAPKRIWYSPTCRMADHYRQDGDVEYIRADAVKRKPLSKQFRSDVNYLISVLGRDGKKIVRELLRRAGGENE